MIFVRSQVEVGEPNQEAGAISESHDTGHSDSRVMSLAISWSGFVSNKDRFKIQTRCTVRIVDLERTGRYRADVAFR